MYRRISPNFLSSNPDLDAFLRKPNPCPEDTQGLADEYWGTTLDEYGNEAGFEDFPPILIALMVRAQPHFYILLREFINAAFSKMLEHGVADEANLSATSNIIRYAHAYGRGLWINHITKGSPDPLQFICNAIQHNGGYEHFSPIQIALIAGAQPHFKILLREFITNAFSRMLERDGVDEADLGAASNIIHYAHQYGRGLWIYRITNGSRDPLQFIHNAIEMANPPLRPTEDDYERDKENNGQRIEALRLGLSRRSSLFSPADPMSVRQMIANQQASRESPDPLSPPPSLYEPGVRANQQTPPESSAQLPPLLSMGEAISYLMNFRS